MHAHRDVMDKVRKKENSVKKNAFTIHDNVQTIHTEMGYVHGSTCLALTLVKICKKVIYILSLKNH